jgi:glycosyltransferase involved in cell wall biosynthesis
MSSHRKISVVIPCFNHGEFLHEAVASVTNLGRVDIELIVVDDGSTDDRTRAEVGKVEAHGIKVIRQQNRGLAAARNTAISSSQGEYILPLDADDRLRSGWIDRGIEVLDSNPKVGVVYGDAEPFGIRVGRWETGLFDASRLLEANYIHASALYRRSVWEQNSGYDGTMPVQGLEDWDFWIGALEHGWQFVYIPEIFFEYRQSPESMITRARGFAGAVEQFIAKKHSAVYRQDWLRLAMERQSATKTSSRLRKLLKVRIQEKLGKRSVTFWVPE